MTQAITAPMRIVSPLPQTGRVMRTPTYNFQLRHLPFVIQPFMIAPVLPGETLVSGLYQARAVTKPIDHPLIGWWMEHYFFYVPFSALPEADAMKELMITEGASLAAISTTANTAHYHKNGPNFVDQCLQSVTETYFRRPEEAWDLAGSTVTQDTFTMPVAKVKNEGFLDSAYALSEIPVTDGVVEDNELGLYDQLDERRLMYDRIMQLGMTTATYEDWLKMNGVKGVEGPAQQARPELLRQFVKWQYPSNTVDPATGVPASAVSWACQGRIDKPRLFKEPGFIFGVSVCRPKVYLNRQYGNVASLFASALNWLPAMVHEPAASIIEVTKTTGPLGSGVADATSPAENYVVDLRDSLLHGDQFVNFDLASTDANFVALPTAAMQTEYPAIADIQSLFTGVTDATRRVVQDGVVALNIKGRQTDQTR